MNVEIKYTNGYEVYINGILINEDIFNEEKADYRLIEREELINDLIMWIEECGSDRESDKFLMKEDLKYLMDLKDYYIFSSISTNDYIAKSDDFEGFKEICEEILKLNEELKNE